MEIPVERLKHDIPVDEAHVQRLAASIKERGQLAPVIIARHNAGVIDGFHRLAALRSLGSKVARCEQVECTPEQFLDARIISASMHKGVSFARVTLWVNEQFEATEWSEKLTAAQAFKISGKMPNGFSSKAFEQAMRAGLDRDAIYEVIGWIKAKSAIWGLTPEQIANILGLAESASPALWSLIRIRKHNREEVLTRPMLAAIAKAIPDHGLQEAVAKKAMAEKLTEKETTRLVADVIAADGPKQLNTVLSTSWLEANKKPQTVFTPLPVMDDAERHRRQVSFQVVTAAMQCVNLAAFFDVMPRPEALHDDRYVKEYDELVAAVVTLKAAIREWTGQDRDVVSELRAQIAHLNDELLAAKRYNKSLETQLTSLRKSIGLGQAKYIEQASS